jgi:hypothetical protein
MKAFVRRHAAASARGARGGKDVTPTCRQQPW